MEKGVTKMQPAKVWVTKVLAGECHLWPARTHTAWENRNQS